jgi:hypothetical protein
MADGRASLDEMLPMLADQAVTEIHMRLVAPLVSGIGSSKLCQGCNKNARTIDHAGAQGHAPLCNLKSRLIDQPW